MNTDPNDKAVILVLFGAAGDLSRRLVVPALYDLFLDGRLPGRFVLFGVDRQEQETAALAADYRRGVEEHSRQRSAAPGDWDRFAASFRYLAADVTRPDAYGELNTQLHTIEQAWHTKADRIFYLATPPTLFAPIAHGLGAEGLAKDRARARIVVEKPLGRDLESFRAINDELSRFFSESQIFRIDHFLGKETVQNILALRFANPIFEPIWNRRYIDHVTVTVAETLGVEHRGGYYERAGALRDMVQNHLLQLLCLVAMEPPVAYQADDVRDRKLDVLRAVRPIAADHVHRFAARGQYGDGWMQGARAPAYRDEEGVDAGSNTETYAALKLYVDNWRWQDVPFFLRTGKRMAADVSEISVRFRDVPHRAFPAAGGLDGEPARLVIQLQPEQGIVLKFLAKEPGYHWRLQPVDMRFSYSEAFRVPSPHAYETLLWDVMVGDATLFMRADQVEAAWRLVMPVLEAWEANPAADFPNYAAGSWGPESAEALIARDGRSWLLPTLTRPVGETQ